MSPFPNKLVTRSGRVFVEETPPPPVKPAPYDVLTVPDDGGRYMVLGNDSDTDKWGGKTRVEILGYKKDPPWNGLPATIPMEKLFYKLNREWQFFYRNLIRRNVPLDIMSDAELLDAYAKTTRDAGGWRDRHTWNDVKNVPPHLHTDYVLGRNLGSGYGDAAQQDLLSSGNIVKVIGDAGDKWIIETLNTQMPPPSVDEVWGQWHKVGFLTLSAYNWDTETRARLKWPFFKGYGCPHMTLGRDGVNRVPKYWCKPIANGAKYSPYSP